MRSPKSPLGWLLAKEWRELWSARAWWLMLLAAGPLVGLSFINSVQQYAELSGLNGTAEGVGEAFSPLVGVWAPTFSVASTYTARKVQANASVIGSRTSATSGLARKLKFHSARSGCST